MSFKNPDLHAARQPRVGWADLLTKARHDRYVFEFLHMMNSEVSAKRLTKNLTDIRDQCRDLGLGEAADCFDTALEAVEEGMKALGREKD